MPAALPRPARGEAPVDVLLTDVVMPGQADGFALARTVQERHPGLKVLVMTGYAEQIDAVARMGYQVIAKPSPRKPSPKRCSAC